jgi:hypothetical protein
MYRRWLSCVLVILAAAPTVARAADDDKSAPPTLVVRVRSVDTVIDNVKQIVTMAGKEDLAPQIEGLIKSKIGPNGIDGIDLKRPLGGYARMGSDFSDVMGAVMIPIADEKAFLSLLENLTLNATKDKTGLYTVKTPAPVPVYFRFAHKYVYVSALNLEALDPKNLMPPSKVFPSDEKAALSAAFRLDQIPDAVKLIATFQFEKELAKARDKNQPGETEKQREFRMEALKQIAVDFKSVLDDGAELSLDLDINKNSGALTVNAGLSGKSNSKLAKKITDLGKSTSLFAGLGGSNTAVQMLLHFMPADAIRKGFAEVIEEGKAKALAAVQDEGKRKDAERLIKALAPTLEAADIDAAFTLNRPEKSRHYNVIAAVKLTEGNHLAKTLHELVSGLLKDIPEAERAKIKLDAESAGSIKIHRLDIQEKYDEKARAVLGNNPLYVAFRDDALFLAVGEGALSALKKAVAAPPAVAPPFQLTVSVARLAKLLTTAGGPDVSFPGTDPGNVTLSIEGGSSLRLRLNAQLSVVQFFSNIANSKAGLGNDND